MGRYYSTSGGRDGKFMFAVQSSDDPEHMGMHEEPPSTITYYADDHDVKKITKKLDKQYDILGVPKEDRIYYLENDYKKAKEFEDKVLHDRVFVTIKDGDERYKGQIGWYNEKKGYTDYEIPGRAICLARIRLALDILSDIKDNGYCSLDAEL